MQRTPPDTAAEIVTLRAAGWTLPAIAQRTGVSLATVKRTCGRHRVKAGGDQAALVAAARKELIAALSDDERVRSIIGGLINDTLGHIALGREKAAEAVGFLEPTDTKTAAVTLRGLAAHATALKAHADTLRSLLPKPELAPDELPILRVETLTADEVAAIREAQRRESALLNGDLEEDETSKGDTDVVETH